MNIWNCCQKSAAGMLDDGNGNDNDELMWMPTWDGNCFMDQWFWRVIVPKNNQDTLLEIQKNL